MEELKEIEHRIEEAETLEDVNRITDDLERIVWGDVSIDEAKEIDRLFQLLHKKTLTVKVS